jgi:peroxiredoxin family protein
MESKVAKEAEQALVEATQRMSPEQRVNAYLAHCRLVMQLYEAGRRLRADAARSTA